MPNNLVLCSIGAFLGRTVGSAYGKIPEVSSQLTCDGIELMFSRRWYDNADVAESCSKASALPLLSMHLDKNIGELISRNENGDIDEALRRFEINCAMANRLGIKLAVLHLWGGIPSDKHIEINIGLLPQLHKKAADFGVFLTVENIVCNQVDSLIHMKTIFERYPEIAAFTIDTRQAAFHEILEPTVKSDFLWENDLIKHIHISDYCGGLKEWPMLGHPVKLGCGKVNFHEFFSVLKSRGYSGMITLESVEMQGDEADITALNDDFAFIRSLL